MKSRYFMLLLALLPLGAGAEPAATLTFRMSWGGMEIAEVTDTVMLAEDGYEIVSDAQTVGLAKLLGGAMYRRSRGARGADGGLQPEIFEQRRGDDEREARIDYGRGVAAITRRGESHEAELSLPQVHDSLTLIYDFYARDAYVAKGASHLTSGRRLSEYEFVASAGPVMMTVAAGEMLATRYERHGDAEEGQYEVWFADEHRRIPVLISLRRGNNHMEFELTGFSFGSP